MIKETNVEKNEIKCKKRVVFPFIAHWNTFDDAILWDCSEETKIDVLPTIKCYCIQHLLGMCVCVCVFVHIWYIRYSNEHAKLSIEKVFVSFQEMLTYNTFSDNRHRICVCLFFFWTFKGKCDRFYYAYIKKSIHTITWTHLGLSLTLLLRPKKDE